MADTTLWCVEACEGLYPMPSKSEAYRFAKRTRQFMKRLQRNDPSPDWPKVFVDVYRYPWSSADHQKGVAEYIEDKKRLITSPKKRRAIKAK